MSLMNMARLAAMLGAVALLAPVAAGDTIDLRPGATIDSARAVLLRDVAALDGRDAAAQGEAEIIPLAELARAIKGRGWVEVDVERVRQILRERGAPMGSLAIAGSTCAVRMVLPAPQLSAEAATDGPDRRAAKGAAALETVSLDGPATVRVRIVQALMSELGVEADALRVRFDQRDQELLDREVGGQTVLARAISAGASAGTGRQDRDAARMLVEVRVLDGDKQILIRSLPVDVSVRRQVLRVKHAVSKRAALGDGDVEVGQQWTTPAGAKGDQDVPSVQGRVARTTLAPGAVVSSEALANPNVVRRGDSIEVWVYPRGLAVKARAIAQKEGAVGDVIPCKLDRNRAAFNVRIDAPGRGTVEDWENTPAPQNADARPGSGAARPVR